MSPATLHNLKEITGHFQLEGEFLEAVPYGTGHINDTYLSSFSTGTGTIHYIHQRINHHVFKEPEKLMENVERVTGYARERIVAAGGNPDRETLTIVPAVDGKSFYKSPADESEKGPSGGAAIQGVSGDYWRTYLFISGARTFEVVEDLRHAYSAAKAFGDFQKLLRSLPGARLHETIPNFHHTRQRFDAFIAAAEADTANRARLVKAEIDFALQRAADTSIVVDLLAHGKLPERVTHNDTKFNNVLIDDLTGVGICVVDLDTVMPGSVLYDFGDLVRTGAATAAEDEQDLSKVGLNIEMFEALAQGYLDAARDFLAKPELDYLAFSGKLITFEMGLRFLTDYLQGDIYYKIHHPQHNLDRCRTQFQLVADMEHRMHDMQAIVKRHRTH